MGNCECGDSKLCNDQNASLNMNDIMTKDVSLYEEKKTAYLGY